jgi:glycosyltransferase involved in cell wall biosynthesis
MKIAWFTPFGSRSAIGEYSKHVVERLAEEIDVVLYVGASADRRATSVPTRLVTDAVDNPSVLDDADFVVYNLGDHFEYHGAIAHVSRLRPGVVVLHDRAYQHLFRGLWHQTDDWPDNFSRSMRFWYGDDGGDAARATASDASLSDALTVRFPLWEEAVANAEGVCVHTRDHAELIRASWAGPVGEIFLPRYPTDDAPRTASDPPVTDRALLVTMGYVNSNKRIDHVLHALHRAPEVAERVKYVVVGPYDVNSGYYGELRELVRAYRLGGTVEFLDYQPDDVLNAYVERADIFVNLRFPTLEGSSASLMRQLASGKPVVAYDVGGFSEIPADAIALVPPLDDAALASQLNRLLTDADLRASLGENGRRWTESRDVSAYAERLVGFLDEVGRSRPILRLADRAARELSSFEVARSLPVVERIAAEIATMRE